MTKKFPLNNYNKSYQTTYVEGSSNGASLWEGFHEGDLKGGLFTGEPSF
jgi:hypothetical protein